jgi:hypothetical protein
MSESPLCITCSPGTRARPSAMCEPRLQTQPRNPMRVRHRRTRFRVTTNPTRSRARRLRVYLVEDSDDHRWLLRDCSRSTLL